MAYWLQRLAYFDFLLKNSPQGDRELETSFTSSLMKVCLHCPLLYKEKVWINSRYALLSEAKQCTYAKIFFLGSRHVKGCKVGWPMLLIICIPDPLAVAVCTWSCSEYLSPIVIFLSSARDVGSSHHYQHTNFYWLHEADQPSCCLSGRADLKHKPLLKHYIFRCTRLLTMTLWRTPERRVRKSTLFLHFHE